MTMPCLLGIRSCQKDDTALGEKYSAKPGCCSVFPHPPPFAHHQKCTTTEIRTTKSGARKSRMDKQGEEQRKQVQPEIWQGKHASGQAQCNKSNPPRKECVRGR